MCKQVLISCFGGVGTFALDLRDSDTAMSLVERVQRMTGAEPSLVRNLVSLPWLWVNLESLSFLI